MPAGLQIWDGAGNLTLDLTDRTGKFAQAGLTALPGSKVNWVTILVPGFKNDGNWAVLFAGQGYLQPVCEYFDGGFRFRNADSNWLGVTDTLGYTVLRL